MINKEINFKGIILISFIIFILMIIITSIPKSNFPKDQIDINVSKKSSLNYIARDLYSKNIIKSEFLFKITVVLLGNQRGIIAGDYRFTKPQNTFIIANRMIKGDQGLPKIKVTIPEGTNIYDMAFIFLQRFPDFNAPRFISLALNDEGYLFPDTYYFLSNVKSEEIIKTMKNNFNKKINSLANEIKDSNRSMKDIIIMASIVEEEAKSLEDRRMVSGILWKRFDEGMLLQVDPPFYYITGKSNGVTYDDLKIKSPYNTYLNKGLPYGPISNPGIDAISATLNPIKSSYYFYLTGNDGTMRYANSYDGHLRNKNVYLK